MGVSTCGQVMVSGGNTQTVSEAPMLLTSVVVAEMTGTAAGAVTITDKDMGAQLFFSVLAGNTISWCPCEPVAVNGLIIGCQLGDVIVSYTYR